MTTATKKQPELEIRIGVVKATIWKNTTERGDRFNTTFSKLYRLPEEDRDGAKDKGWRETQSFAYGDLLALKKVADKAHTWIHEQNGETSS